MHIQEAHRKNDADFRVRPVHAVKGTWGSDFIKELYPEEDEYIVQKRRHSGFAYTDLDLYLREENTNTVVVTGVWTNVCVRSTASDALYSAYKVIALSDGCASKTEEMHEYGLNDLGLFAKILTIDEFTNAIDNGIDPWIGGGCRFHAIVSINKKSEGDSKAAIISALSSDKDLKHVVIVDEDIDIFDS